MFIDRTIRWKKIEGSSATGTTYYRLCESYRDSQGKPKRREVISLGMLEGFDEDDRKELGRLLHEMIAEGRFPISENECVYNEALKFYTSYNNSERKEKAEARLREEEEQRKDESCKNMVLMKLSSLRNLEARTIGAEAVCYDTVKKLNLRQMLRQNGLSERQTQIAIMQIIARAVYPGSELRTARCLRENSALCELLKMKKEEINKDMLYRSALRLYDIRREMEDELHNRVCSMFDIEEKIYLFDLTNTYFEGKMETSELCQYGRSKEKRSDCKIVALAAVVNTDGLLVRTEIFEGNRQDVSTLEDVIGSLSKGTAGKRKIIVMDAGFSSESNLRWLRENGYDYITVTRSRGQEYTPLTDRQEYVNDNKKQIIHLQKVQIEGISDKILLVDSEAKTLKENSMFLRAKAKFEDGLLAIRKGIEGHGIKKRDKVQQRIGRLTERYPQAARLYSISTPSDENDVVKSITWEMKDTAKEQLHAHGKYFLRTTLAESEKNVWMFYNVIRTVEETFKTLKSDLDIRPVFHKNDKGTKAHLNLAILAYWVVSVTKYRLSQCGIHLRWEELLRIMNAQVRVTTEFEGADHRIHRVRRSTEPEEKMSAILSALSLTPRPAGQLNFVVHKNPSQKKYAFGNQEDNDP